MFSLNMQYYLLDFNQYSMNIKYCPLNVKHSQQNKSINQHTVHPSSKHQYLLESTLYVNIYDCLLKWLIK